MRTNTQPYSNIRGHYPFYPSASYGMGNRIQLFAYAYYRLSRVIPDLEKEAAALEAKIAELDVDDPADEIQESYERFFALAKQYTYIETLDRDTLVTFIDRIEVGEKILPQGYEKMPPPQGKFNR